jgi:hypothetical protein
VKLRLTKGAWGRFYERLDGELFEGEREPEPARKKVTKKTVKKKAQKKQQGQQK